MSSSNWCFLTCIQVSQEADVTLTRYQKQSRQRQSPVFQTPVAQGTHWPVSATLYSSVSISCVCVSVVSNLHNPLDCSLPGSSVYGTFQAGILKWVATPSSWGPSWPQLEPASPLAPALQADSLTTEPPGKPPWPLRVHQLAGQNFCQQINSQVGAFTCQKQNHLAYKQHHLTLATAFQKQHPNACPKWSQNQPDFQLT